MVQLRAETSKDSVGESGWRGVIEGFTKQSSITTPSLTLVQQPSTDRTTRLFDTQQPSPSSASST
jgi:hypothetical protein